MIRQGYPVKKEDAPNLYFSSFEGKYTIIDNLDEKGEPIVQAHPEMYNAEYVYVTVVLRGTLHMIVGGAEIEMKANDYLAVMPCMSVTVLESRCLFFSTLVSSYIMAEIYKRNNMEKILHFHAFKFRHAHFSPENINLLLACYKHMKAEHERENYPMKEIVLRSYQSAYLAKLFSFITEEDIINYVKNSRQYKFFNEFIYKLNQMHQKERAVQYYANELGITPKYLSAIVHTYTGMTASQAIDQYVIFAIKQSLYANDRNIKTISEEFHFPSQSFFGRYFKRITGVSPNTYIKEHNIKAINFTQIASQEL